MSIRGLSLIVKSATASVAATNTMRENFQPIAGTRRACLVREIRVQRWLSPSRPNVTRPPGRRLSCWTQTPVVYRCTVTGESAYAYFRRSFSALWRDPKKPLWMKFVVTVVAFIAGVLGSLGFSVYRGWKRISRRVR